MHVPQHITVVSDNDQTYIRQPISSVSEKYAYQMNVPERILVAGGNETRGDRAPPSEVMLDRMAAFHPTAVSYFYLFLKLQVGISINCNILEKQTLLFSICIEKSRMGL